MRRVLSTVTVCLLVSALATACGDDSDGGSTQTTQTQTIEVTVEDGEVTPAGDRIDVAVDQPVDIIVTSDEAGELHVHSSPETTEQFDAGTSEPIQLQFDRPGVVEIELHEPFEGPIVSLEVK